MPTTSPLRLNVLLLFLGAFALAGVVAFLDLSAGTQLATIAVTGAVAVARDLIAPPPPEQTVEVPISTFRAMAFKE